MKTIATLTLTLLATGAHAAPSVYLQSEQGQPITNFQNECWMAMSETEGTAYQIDCTKGENATMLQQVDKNEAMDQTSTATDKDIDAAVDGPLQDGNDTVTLRSTFEFDDAALKPVARQQLVEVARQLKSKIGKNSVTVRGYADRIGDAGYNQRLSQARAQSVKSVLVQEGIASDRINARGMGAASSMSQNCSDENRQQLISCLEVDRRVEVEMPTFEADLQAE